MAACQAVLVDVISFLHVALPSDPKDHLP